MTYTDAHSHLHLPPLAGLDLSAYWAEVGHTAVNGTAPPDWPAVAELARQYSDQVAPQFGVHPWEVVEGALPTGWERSLCSYLEQFPHAGVGEVGIDKWIRGHDLPLQRQVLLTQIQIANDYQRPLSLHCLKAWGSLRDILQAHPPVRPFLLHAYAGPAEWVADFVSMGAYFSFSPYFLHDRKRDAAQERFSHVPLHRLLLETDAPSMLGPAPTWSPQQKAWSDTDQHPANLIPFYQQAATALGLPLVELTTLCAHNYRQLFLTSVVD